MQELLSPLCVSKHIVTVVSPLGTQNQKKNETPVATARVAVYLKRQRAPKEFMGDYYGKGTAVVGTRDECFGR
jgi:hypothetical protein